MLSSWSGSKNKKPSLCQVELGVMMPKCPQVSLRSMQLSLDHLVEIRDRAVCHQHQQS